ncbi:hypothetical protein EVG20_g1307 [Dentipellis fragilis]|uniref:SHSP domain-containing protein n=1 Tax=Dentipellis fragilis TaxID=205917 RepID=A0A4Y9ZD17_9AGAM|nr:hypothetical protein EVG20_g1307 [Dentipellis fragilis]
MSLTRFFYEPFYSLADFDKLFDEAFSARSSNGDVQRRQSRGNIPASNNGLLRPRMDLHDNAETNTITAIFELPGLKKEDVHLDIQNNALTISGETTVDSSRDESGYAVRERRFGKFSRTLPLPQGIKHEEIKAAMENGVLTVTFPKTAPEQAPQRITISSPDLGDLLQTPNKVCPSASYNPTLTPFPSSISSNIPGTLVLTLDRTLWFDCSSDLRHTNSATKAAGLVKRNLASSSADTVAGWFPGTRIRDVRVIIVHPAMNNGTIALIHSSTI